MNQLQARGAGALTTGAAGRGESRFSDATLTPPVDVIEDAGGITLYADLPGVTAERLNLQIAAGRVQNRGGQNLREKIDGGLVRADGRFLYPLQQNIPLLLVDEAIPLGR